MSEHKRKKSTALFLAAFPWTGCLGIDRFYLGLPGAGIFKLLTCGGFFIMYVNDIIRIARGEQTDKNGSPLEDSNGEPFWPNTGLKKEALLYESAQARLSALDRMMASYDGVYSHYSEAALRDGVRETALETFRAAALNDPDGENRLYAARLLDKAGTLNDLTYILEQSEDTNVLSFVFRRIATSRLQRITSQQNGSLERAEAEEKLVKAMRSYFFDENHGFHAERLQAYLEEAKLSEDSYRLFRELFFSLTEAADCLGNSDGTWSETGNVVRTLFKTDEDITRDKLIAVSRGEISTDSVSMVEGLRDVGVPGADVLLQLRRLTSLTEEQKQILAELPEDMVKALLTEGRMSDACVTALHDSPKWKRFVEENVPRVRRETVGYKTIHDENDDRLYDEEVYQCFERW